MGKTKRFSPRSVNTILLSRQNLLHNYSYLSSLNKAIRIAPVLKSNTYGYGLSEVAEILDTVKAPFFCVNSFYEAYALHKVQVKTPILIMGYVDQEDLKSGSYPFSYAAYNYSQLQTINAYQKNAGVHIFVDTGMHREGFRVHKLPLFLRNLKKYSGIKIEGIMSHFAMADQPDSPLTLQQLENFLKARNMIVANGVKPRWVHIGASAGLLVFAGRRGIDIGNIARVGKALYGIDPRGKNNNLRPILKMVTKIVQIKELEKGDTVGYDAMYTVTKPTTIAILPIGYYDGVDRRLSNTGVMLVDDTHCPIVGRVSMNITTIDISSVKDPRVGQEVIVYSDNEDDPNSIIRTAELCQTIPYDIVVGIPESVKRTVF